MGGALLYEIVITLGVHGSTGYGNLGFKVMKR